MLYFIFIQVIDDPDASTSRNEDSGGLFDSPSILASQRKQVAQTDDESGDGEAGSEDDGAPTNRQCTSAPAETEVPAANEETTTSATATEGKSAPAPAPVRALTDGEEEEGEQGESNNVSSSFVADEIKNCQHQINMASIALEQLRKVINLD